MRALRVAAGSLRARARSARAVRARTVPAGAVLRRHAAGPRLAHRRRALLLRDRLRLRAAGLRDAAVRAVARQRARSIARRLHRRRAGALLQLDVGALTGRYGKQARRLARSFLESGLYAIGATDLHSARDAHAWVGEALAELHALSGDAGLSRMMGENPGRILRGEALPEP